MPYPSRACKTCRQRHVKCDETYPVCNRCIRAGKTCLGFKTPPDEFAFRDENDFAGGLPRRPRDSSQNTSKGGAQPLASTTSTMSESMISFTATLPTASLSVNQIVISTAHTFSSIPRSPDPSLETYAFAEFARRYVDSQYNLPNGLWGHLKYYRTEWECTEQRSSLGIAATALALALFGRISARPSALRSSIKQYNDAVSKTRIVLQNSNQISDDRTLVTIMLLDAFEGTVGGLDRNVLSPQRFWHQNGATMLLKLRKDNISSDQHDSNLDKDIRRRLIRTSIMQGNLLPEWLHDGNRFGETGVELRLDNCLIQVCQLRRNLQIYLERLREGSCIHQRSDLVSASILIDQALAVDQALVTWARSLPPDWLRMPQSKGLGDDSSIYAAIDGTKHIDYPSTLQDLQIASTWNTFRAARLITNGMIGRLSGPNDTERQTVADMTIRALVSDILATVPLFLGHKSSQGQKHSLPDNHDKHAMSKTPTAGEAGLLVFPLVVAATVSRITETERASLLAQIRSLSKVTGSCTLESFACSKSFILR